MGPQAETIVMQEAREYLAEHCEVMARLVERHTPRTIKPQDPDRYFEVLVESVVGQQLSVKAAATINDRLRALVPDMHPEQVVGLPTDRMREAGLSQAKTSSVLGMAQAFHSGVIDPYHLLELPDEQVIAKLTELKGIGPWTAEMFLMFGMARPDVWSPGDLGLRRAVMNLFCESIDIEAVTDRWRPYRTYAALYLWEHADNVPNNRGSQPHTGFIQRFCCTQTVRYAGATFYPDKPAAAQHLPVSSRSVIAE